MFIALSSLIFIVILYYLNYIDTYKYKDDIGIMIIYSVIFSIFSIFITYYIFILFNTSFIQKKDKENGEEILIRSLGNNGITEMSSSNSSLKIVGNNKWHTLNLSNPKGLLIFFWVCFFILFVINSWFGHIRNEQVLFYKLFEKNLFLIFTPFIILLFIISYIFTGMT